MMFTRIKKINDKFMSDCWNEPKKKKKKKQRENRIHDDLW